MTDLDVPAKLMAKVGQPVHFTYPGTETERRGVLQDRIVIPDTNPNARPGPPYWHVVDLIRFEGEPEPSIRVTYYRQQANGRLTFAGQTSICTPASSWAPLLAAVEEIRRRSAPR